MAEKYEHKVNGYHWKREKTKEETLEGWIKFEDGDIKIEGTGEEKPNQHKKGLRNLNSTLRRLGKNTEVKIKIEAWNWEEVEEKSNFNPFEEEQKYFGDD